MITIFEKYKEDKTFTIKELFDSFDRVSDFEKELEILLIDKIVSFFTTSFAYRTNDLIKGRVYRIDFEYKDKIREFEYLTVEIIVEDEDGFEDYDVSSYKPIIVHELETDAIKYNL